ncbi:MAG: hypothetical protein EBZ48_12630, partial [Proteobacteria bacterium]|nr:hypothetical protein [Pseudomonadota bacterium]
MPSMAISIRRDVEGVIELVVMQDFSGGANNHYSVPWVDMSANLSLASATQLWKRFPDNARIGFFLVCLIVFWRLPLGGSLWLDEGITAWITRDTLIAAAAR